MTRQTTPYTREAYIQAGCHQFGGTGGSKEDPVAMRLWVATDGFLCNGCPHMRNRCTAYAKLANAPLHISRSAPAAGESVRDEAKRRGISISEVRRQRAAAASA